MESRAIRLYSLNYSDVKTYMFASLFILGNIALPQMFHLATLGGLTWLPIYFFTLIGAYKYGWKVGLLTAILSPVLNSVMFGMPSVAVLPAILFKSMILAFVAGLASNRFNKISIPILLGVVLSYQIAGTLVEWILVKDFFIAIQDFRIGIPGMCLQVFGGYLIIKHLIYK